MIPVLLVEGNCIACTLDRVEIIIVAITMIVISNDKIDILSIFQVIFPRSRALSIHEAKWV